MKCLLRRRAPRVPSAFTLIELLTVIAVIAILAAILIPVVSNVRASGYQTQSASNLRQLGTAANLWSQDNGGIMLWNQDDNSNPFTVLIAPYLGLEVPDGNYKQYFQDRVGQAPEGVFDNPAIDDMTRSGNFADYGINIYVSGWQSSTAAHLKGGWRQSTIPEPAKTIWMAESKECTKNIRGDWGAIVATHPGDTLNILFVDGHVEQWNIEEATANTDRNDYPWGWPGHP